MDATHGRTLEGEEDGTALEPHGELEDEPELPWRDAPCRQGWGGPPCAGEASTLNRSVAIGNIFVGFGGGKNASETEGFGKYYHVRSCIPHCFT